MFNFEEFWFSFQQQYQEQLSYQVSDNYNYSQTKKVSKKSEHYNDCPAVPEPTGLILFAAGVIVLLLSVRKMRRKPQ